MDELDTMKQENGLLHLADQLTTEADCKGTLASFFRCTLSPDPNLRSGSFFELVQLLSNTE
jgi:hypothetical protein